MNIKYTQFKYQHDFKTGINIFISEQKLHVCFYKNLDTLRTFVNGI